MPDNLLSRAIDFSPVVVERQTSLQAAIAAMKRAHFTAIWVVETDPSGAWQLQGSVFPTQLLQALAAAANLASLTVESIMRCDLPQFLPTATISLEQWLQHFEQHQVDFLPVVNSDKALIGVLSKWQLLQNHCQCHTPSLQEQLFESAQDGFFMMMLDEPISWNDETDKAAALEYVFHHQRITKVNEALLRQYGVPEAELLDKTPADFFAHDLAYGKGVWQEFFDRGIMSEITEERRFDDDTPLWIEGFYTCLYDARGRILGHFGIQRDVTHYKAMEANLIRQERYLYVIVAIQQQLLASGHQFIFDHLNQQVNLAAAAVGFSFRSSLRVLQPIYRNILRRLGEAAEASRVYLFEHQGDRLMGQQLQWCAEGISPATHQDGLQHLVYRADGDRWFDALSMGQSIHTLTQDLPPSDRHLLAAQGTLSILVLPLMVNGEFWGAIGFDNCQAASLWDDSEVTLLAAGAAALSMHLENCQVAYQLYRNWYRERLTYQLVERLHQTLQIDDIFETTTRNLRALLGCDRTLIYRFNSDWSGSFVAESIASGWLPLSQIYPDSPLLEESATNDVACQVRDWRTQVPFEVDTYLQESQGGDYRQGKPYSCVEDIYQANFETCYLELLDKIQAKAYLLAPIFLGNHLWGLLCNYQNSGARQWSSDDINLALHITTQLGIALQHVELLEQTRQQALELAKAKSAAEAATRARTEFLANVSHELRTPLNAILGFSEILGHEMRLSPSATEDSSLAEQQEYIDIINRNGQYLLNLINNVVEIARLESGQSQVLATAFDLHQLLQDIEGIYTKRVAPKGLQLIFQLSPQLPQIITSDRDKLLQVLLNLLNNAVKFTESGRITLKADVQNQVQIDARLARVNLAFTVEDTGAGITTEELSKLFQPFSKPQSQQTDQGPALGLAISRKFVNMLGGDISVTSTVDHGSRFKFNIWAIAGPDAAPEAIGSDSPSANAEQPPLLIGRILIVEPHPQESYQLKQVLSPLGCDLRTATNSQDALTLWAKWRPHLLFINLDADMVDGLALAQQLQQQTDALDSATAQVATKVIGLMSDHRSLLTEPAPIGFDNILDWSTRSDWPTQQAALLKMVTQYLEPPPSPIPSLSDLLETSVTTTAQPPYLPRSYLAQIPLTWRQQVYQAALTGSDQKLFQLVAQLTPEHDRLRQLLTTLTENYQFDQIIALLSDH